jgi:hypothetical protein
MHKWYSGLFSSLYIVLNSSAYQHAHQQTHRLSIDCKDSLWLNPAEWHDIVIHLHLLPDLFFCRISYLMIMVICLPSPLCCTCSLHQCIWYNPLTWYIIQLLLAVSPKSLSRGSWLHRTPLYCCGDACQAVHRIIARWCISCRMLCTRRGW